MSLSDDEPKRLYIEESPESTVESELTPSIGTDTDTQQRNLDFEYESAENVPAESNPISSTNKSNSASGKSDTESDANGELEKLQSQLFAFVANRDAKSRKLSHPGNTVPVSSISNAGESSEDDPSPSTPPSEQDEPDQPTNERPLTKNAVFTSSGDLILQKSVPTHDNSVHSALAKGALLHHLAKGTQHDRNIRTAIQSCNFVPGLNPLEEKLNENILFLNQSSTEMGLGHLLKTNSQDSGKTGFDLNTWVETGSKFPFIITVKNTASCQTVSFSVLASGNTSLRDLGHSVLSQLLLLEDCELQRYAAKGLDNFAFTCDLSQNQSRGKTLQKTPPTKETAITLIDTISENVGDVTTANSYTRLKFQQFTDGSIPNLEKLALGKNFNPPLKPSCTIAQWLEGGLPHTPKCYEENPKGKYAIQVSMFIQTRYIKLTRTLFYLKFKNFKSKTQ